MPSVVWIVPKAPLPAFDGARVAVCGLLNELTGMGLEIHLVIVNAENQSSESDLIQRELGVASVTYEATAGAGWPLPPRLRSACLSVLRPLLGLTLQRYATANVRNTVRKLLERTAAETVVFDGLHPAAAFSSWSGTLRAEPGTNFVYRAHNRETQIWQRKAESTRNTLARLFFKGQAWLVQRFEDSLVRVAACTCPVSSEDGEQFRQVVPKGNYRVVPIGYDFSRPVAKGSHSDRVFFIGRLDWPPNREGLRWFLEEVWPSVNQQRSDLSLDIVGSGNGDWMRAFQNLPGVAFHGRVESIESFYDAAAVCIIPVFFGSGTRVKAIESARYGRACISTAMGVEGLPLEAGTGYVRAETAGEWVEAIVSMESKSLEQIGLTAHKALSTTFDRGNCAREMLNAMFPGFEDEPDRTQCAAGEK